MKREHSPPHGKRRNLPIGSMAFFAMMSGIALFTQDLFVIVPLLISVASLIIGVERMNLLVKEGIGKF